MKKYVVPLLSPVPDLDTLDDIFLGTTLAVPDLEGSLSKVMIGAFTVESIDGHKRGVGASLTNFQYHLKLEGYPTQMGIWRHVCLLYTSPSPRDQRGSRMPSSA